MSTPPPDAAPTPYELMLTLDDLESLREELEELGASTDADLASLATGEALALLTELRALGLDSLAALTDRIAALHRQLDHLESTS
jgi:hypothetical protein